jgi:membrane-bound lytic murein transglycosylase D
VAQAESDNLVDLINNYSHPYWGFPPKNFYAEFLAAVEIGKNIQRYFPGLEPDSPLAIQEVEVKKGSSLAALASAKGLTREQFLEWNPALSTAASVVPAGYKMKFPADSNAATVVAMVDRRSGEPRQEEKPPMVRHRVRPGETIGQIARRYGASVEKILQVNGIRRAHLIQIGTMLLIPKI